MRFEGGAPGTSLEAPRWAAIHALLDGVWPGVVRGIARAEAWGASWAAQSTPFVAWEGDRALAHVGVLEHRVRIDGQDRIVAGVHAVCSHPDARGRGLVRRLLEAANAHIDARGLAAKLHTDFPDLYARVGYRTLPTWRFVLERGGDGGGEARRVTDQPDDLGRLRERYARRDVLSDAFDHRGDAALALTNASLAKGDLSWFHHVDGLDAVVAFEHRDDTLHLLDVAAPRRPALDDLLAAIPVPFARVVFAFSPDRLAPGARPVAVPADEGVFQVRGAWPEGPPLAIPQPWAH